MGQGMGLDGIQAGVGPAGRPPIRLGHWARPCLEARPARASRGEPGASRESRKGPPGAGDPGTESSATDDAGPHGTVPPRRDAR